MDSETLQKAMEAAMPAAFLKLEFCNHDGEFQICIDGESTNHHDFSDVPEEVFSGKWRASAMQEISPDLMASHVEWLIGMGQDGRNPESEAILDHWLSWASASLVDLDEGDERTRNIAKVFCGIDRNGEAPGDYAGKLAFADRLMSIDAKLRERDICPILESDTYRSEENRFYHGFAFAQDHPGGKVVFERSWAAWNDDMDSREKLGEMPEDKMGNAYFIESFAREKYCLNERQGQPMAM